MKINKKEQEVLRLKPLQRKKVARVSAVFLYNIMKRGRRPVLTLFFDEIPARALSGLDRCNDVTTYDFELGRF